MALIRARQELINLQPDEPDCSRRLRKRFRQQQEQVLHIPPIDTATSSETASPVIRWGARRKICYKSKQASAARTWTGEDLQIVPCEASDRYLKVPRDMHGRWSPERYNAAQDSLVSILHEKNAVPGAPILRQNLRIEARRFIGDTGLLDHLLKHMTDQIVSSGERFRRRHNCEGAMEYWLEDASLLDIRKAENIKDPYWIPPPGWRPGDSIPPSDAELIKSLTEEVEQLKNEIQILSKNDPPPALPYSSFYSTEEFTKETEERPQEEGSENTVMERLLILEQELHKKIEEDRARYEMMTVEKLTLETQFANLWKAVMTMQEKLSNIEASIQSNSSTHHNNNNTIAVVDDSRHRSAFVPCSTLRRAAPASELEASSPQPPHHPRPCRPQATYAMPGLGIPRSSLAAFNNTVEGMISPRSSSESATENEPETIYLSAAVQALQDSFRPDDYIQQEKASSWLGLGPGTTLLHA